MTGEDELAKDKYIDIWIVDGKNVTSGYNNASEAYRKAKAEPGATVHKERLKIRQDASNAEIRKSIGTAASGYREEKHGCCGLLMLGPVLITMALLPVVGLIVVVMGIVGVLVATQ